MPTRLEALVDAFGRMLGMLDPQSVAYHNRNPLLLKAYSPKHLKDENGIRIFQTFPGGLDNALIDVRIKCSGESRSRLSPQSTLTELVEVYGHPKTATKYIVNFLRHALRTDEVTVDTPLGWFLEDSATQTQGK